MIGTSGAESLSRIAGDEQLNRIQRTGDSAHQQEGRKKDKKRREDDSGTNEENQDKVTLSAPRSDVESEANNVSKHVSPEPQSGADEETKESLVRHLDITA